MFLKTPPQSGIKSLVARCTLQSRMALGVMQRAAEAVAVA